VATAWVAVKYFFVNKHTKAICAGWLFL